ncbi:MAG: hypothetical protein E7633_10520 [Ruminococcaceae bacterium]|nr:hypothetical protein [Oscillospiraceae bacterium]
MKKYILVLMLFVLISFIVGCKSIKDIPNEDIDINDDEKNEEEKEDSKPSGEDPDYSEYFSNLDDFKNYISNKENQSKHCPIDDGVYVDFSSILPDSEIKQISVLFHNYYYVNYIEKNDDIFFGLSFSFKTSPTKEKYDYTVEEMIKSGALNETPIKSISELKDYKATTGYTWVEIGEYNLLYYDNKSLSEFTITINDYIVSILWNNELSADDYTSAQSEFLSALVSEYGATNESVIEMLDKIKALIPKE